MLNWLFGERGQREKCFAHSRERLHRGGNYVWSLTHQGHYFLFGSRPGGAEVPEYRFQTLQLAVIQRQKESNRQVADLIITTRVAHDLIATGGLGYGELHRSEVRQTDNGWQIVILGYFAKNGTNLVIEDRAGRYIEFIEYDLLNQPLAADSLGLMPA